MVQFHYRGAKHGKWCNAKMIEFACKYCSEPVLYYSCDCGCKVFFDSGHPKWEHHDCLEEESPSFTAIINQESTKYYANLLRQNDIHVITFKYIEKNEEIRIIVQTKDAKQAVKLLKSKAKNVKKNMTKSGNQTCITFKENEDQRHSSYLLYLYSDLQQQLSNRLNGTVKITPKSDTFWSATGEISTIEQLQTLFKKHNLSCDTNHTRTGSTLQARSSVFLHLKAILNQDDRFN